MKQFPARWFRAGLSHAILCCFLVSGAEAAGPSAPPAPAMPSLAAELAAEKAQTAALLQAIEEITARPAYPPDIQSKLLRQDGELQLAYQSAQLAKYDHLKGMLAVESRIYEWQRSASWAVTVLVILVTLSGLLFSGAQLAVSLRALWNANMPGLDTDKTGITISPTEVSLTSAGIGVVVLTLSIAFLYLFLDKVYRIEALPASLSAAVEQPRPPAVAKEN